MTTTVKAPRKLTISRNKVAREASGKPVKPPESPKSARSAKSGPVAAADVLVIGGQPRVRLLPPEVVARKKAGTLRRRLVFVLVGLVVVVAVALGLATVSMITAQNALASAQSQTTSLLQQQGKYGQVLKVHADVSAIQSSQKLATAQEIAWRPYILDLQRTLPAGASITSFSASIDAPFASAPAVTDPLQGPHIATVNATLSMPQASISSWLDTIPQLKGFVDATPNSVTAASGDKLYTVSVTIHINDGALANRFAKAGN